MASTMVLSPTMVEMQRSRAPSSREKFEHESTGRSKPSKRLTLNFPIVPPTPHLDRHPSPPPNMITSAESMHSAPQLPSAASPSESNSFLTSLATQERRVLELREELQKAEADLALLKKQWAQYEAGRKKDELRHVARLQPLPITQPAIIDGQTEGGTTPAAALRASLENGTDRPVVRKSTQRMFSGSRHTRTLSLLSPGATTSQAIQSGPFEKVLSPTVTATDIHSKQPSLSTLSTLIGTEQNIGFSRTYKQLAGRRSMPPPAKEMILNSGKKMASELREGLFTFFEDIREATVGDEGINGTETRAIRPGKSRRQGPRGMQGNEQNVNRTKVREDVQGEKKEEKVTKLTRRNTGIPASGPEKEDSFWKEFGWGTPSNKATKPIPATAQQKSENSACLIDIDDSWDLWDSPRPPQQSPNHREAGNEKPRADSNELPWPELRKLTPSRLSRTVSDLMKEWESPPVTPPKSLAGLDDQAVASPHI